MEIRLEKLIIWFECTPKLAMSLGAHDFCRIARRSAPLSMAAMMLTFASCSEKSISVSVGNPTGEEIGPRCVEIPAESVLKKLRSPAFYVTDAKGQEIVSQLTSDSLILFMADVPAGENQKFKLRPSDNLHSYESTVGGRFYPKRRDDVAYENELVGFRIYGPGTQRAGEKSFGYDLFLKHPTPDFIVPQLYAMETDDAVWARVDSLRKIDKALAEEYVNSFSYHIDHGLGMDCYAVGSTLGAGVAALLEGESIRYPWCYEKAEIIDNGPLRFTLALDFAPVASGEDTEVTEHRLISLDSQSHLNRCRVWYDGLGSSRRVVAGFPLRDNSPVIRDEERGIIAYADPTQGPDNGKALVGVVMESTPDSIFDKEKHALLSKVIAPSDTVTYKWGFAWDRTDIPTLDDWKKHLDTSHLNYTVTLK